VAITSGGGEGDVGAAGSDGETAGAGVTIGCGGPHALPQHGELTPEPRHTSLADEHPDRQTEDRQPDHGPAPYAAHKLRLTSINEAQN